MPHPYPPEYDWDPTCDCPAHPETHLHCPECKAVMVCPGDPETGDTADLAGFTPNDEQPVCPVCNAKAKIDPMETGFYVGDGRDGIYVDWAVSDDGTMVYFSSVVDCDTGSFTDAFGGDEWCPIAEAHDMAVKRLYEAADWCIDSGGKPIRYSRRDFKRFLKEAKKQFPTS